MNITTETATEHTTANKIPVWKRYTLTATEAAEYYHIGEGKLRRIAEKHPDADFIIQNGNRLLFKRQRSRSFLDNSAVI